MREHAGRGERCARYTRAHPVERLEALWAAPDKCTAQRLEYRIKRLPAGQKRQLLRCPERWADWVPELAETDFSVVAGASLEEALNPEPGPSKEEARHGEP